MPETYVRKITSPDGVRQAVYEFGAVGLGIVVSSTVMDDFNAGKAYGTG
jgi:hypothetical protein